MKKDQFCKHIREGVNYLESSPERIEIVIAKSKAEQEAKRLRRLKRSSGAK